MEAVEGGTCGTNCAGFEQCVSVRPKLVNSAAPGKSASVPSLKGWDGPEMHKRHHRGDARQEDPRGQGYRHEKPITKAIARRVPVAETTARRSPIVKTIATKIPVAGAIARGESHRGEDRQEDPRGLGYRHEATHHEGDRQEGARG